MDLAERLQNLVESQQAARAALERQAAQLERALEEAERRAIAAEGALRESREELSRRAEAQVGLERQLVELQSAREEADRLRNELEQAHQAAAAARDEIGPAVESRVVELRADAEQARAELEQERVRAAEEAQRTHTEWEAALEQTRTELTRIKAEAEEAHLKYGELERAHAALQEAHGSYERQIESAQVEVERAQARAESERAAKEATEINQAESDQALAEAADHLADEGTAAFEALTLEGNGDAASEQPAPEGPLDGVAKAQLGWSTRRLVRRQLDRIADGLEPGELALYMATGVYERTPTLLVATDRRLVLAGERDDQLSAITYADVREVRQRASGRRWFARPRLEIATAHGEAVVEDVTENVEALTQHIASKSPQARVAPSDGADG